MIKRLWNKFCCSMGWHGWCYLCADNEPYLVDLKDGSRIPYRKCSCCGSIEAWGRNHWHISIFGNYLSQVYIPLECLDGVYFGFNDFGDYNHYKFMDSVTWSSTYNRNLPIYGYNFYNYPINSVSVDEVDEKPVVKKGSKTVIRSIDDEVVE